MPISKKIFRAYDIRGVYPTDLNRDTARLIGLAFGAYLVKHLKKEHPTVVVGRDNRLHGLELSHAFTEALVESGCHVTGLGLSPSPYVYFANTFGGFDAGCNITASHNPKDDNGFKLMLKNAHAVFGDELMKLYDIIREEAFVHGQGSLEEGHFTTDYLKALQGLFQFEEPLKVAVDTGNGVAGKLYPSFIKAMGHDVSELYTELDGTFPNHEPDPIVEANLKDLKQMVTDEGADIGLAFDGDGDRVGLVTERGEFVDADKALMLLSKDALSRHPGRSVVFTVSNSQVLFELVEAWGGKPVMCKVGHSFVEDAMHKHRAIAGGEQSGHFFLPEGYYAYDDALVTSIRVLKIVADSGKTLSELLSEFPKTFSQPEQRPYCDDDVKFEVIERITGHFKSKHDCVTLDGVRINFGNGAWAGIRASNTSPRLSITMEAKRKDELEAVRMEVMEHLKGYDEIDWQK